MNEAIIQEGNAESGDWFASFCGAVSTGARQYLGDTIDIPVMGYDGSDGAYGYMQSDDIPTFKIYDASTNEYYNAVASEDIPWTNLGNSVSSLSAITNSVSNCPD